MGVRSRCALRQAVSAEYHYIYMTQTEQATISTFPIANAAPVRSELGHLIASYAIHLRDGRLVSSRRLSHGDTARPNERVWYAYAEPLPNSGFFGDQTYPDLLSAAMTKRFIEVTHAVYEKDCGEEFGSTVPSIFTDEPQYCPMSTLNIAEGEQDIFLPWTLEMPSSFKDRYGSDLLDQLPEIIWDSSKGGLARYQFLDNCCEMFASNYIGVLAEWCQKRGLYCTGHMNAVSLARTLLSWVHSQLTDILFTGTHPVLPDGADRRGHAMLSRHAATGYRHALR